MWSHPVCGACCGLQVAPISYAQNAIELKLACVYFDVDFFHNCAEVCQQIFRGYVRDVQALAQRDLHRDVLFHALLSTLPGGQKRGTWQVAITAISLWHDVK